MKGRGKRREKKTNVEDPHNNTFHGGGGVSRERRDLIENINIRA